MRIGFLFLAFLLSAISATGQTVTNTNDSGPGSLRDVITNAASGSTVTFASSLAGSTIDIDTTIEILTQITLDGGTNNITIDAGDTSRIFLADGVGFLTISNLTLQNGGQIGAGGAIKTSGLVHLNLTNMRFISCNAANDGGAVHVEAGNHYFANCLFIGNSAGSWGGALYKLNGTIIIESCLFSGNLADRGGAAFLRGGASANFVLSSTFASNRAITTGGAFYLYDMNLTIRNSILWHNSSGGSITNAPSLFSVDTAPVNVDVEYSNVEGSGGSASWVTGFGNNVGNNLDVNPMFFNLMNPTTAPSAAGDYRTQQGSPCHNVGNNAYSSVTDDLDGNMRIVGVIDLGAYEFCNSFSSLNPVVCSVYTSPSSTVYNASATFYDTIPNSLGCDSIIYIDLTVNNTFDTIYPTACNSFMAPSGATYTSSGTYLDVIPNAASCDSNITIYLTILNSTNSTINPVACNSYTSPSGTYTWNASGLYMDTIPNAAGCDSVITINLSLASTSSVTNVTACDSYTSPSGSFVWNTSGTFMDTILNTAGCDSVMTINLTITTSTTGALALSGCDSVVGPSGASFYTSGPHTDIIPNAAGCDSVITITATITNSTSETINPTLCASGSYLSPGGMTYTSPGIYNETITNAAGCDSNITINLQSPTFDLSTSYENGVIMVNGTADSYQWVSCSDGTQVAGATFQDFEPIDAGRYAVILTIGTCLDTSDCVEVDALSLMPTAFSPNGDGFNDTWIIPVLSDYPENTVLIVNRWGDEVMSFSNYNNLDVVWDGNNSSGEALPAGTYFYAINITGLRQSLSGWIQITR